MKRLCEYIKLFDAYPDQIVLKKVKHGIYYQGKVQTVPETLKEYFVLDHSRLTKGSYVIFTIVEGV